jgi:signal transduction histidine kinase
LKRGRLQTRIARHIAFAVVVSLVLSALVLVVFRHRSVQRNMEQSARTYASLVSKPLAGLTGYLGSSGRGILDQQVAALRELNRDVTRLEIVDVRGDIVLRAESGTVNVYGDGVDPPTITDGEILRAITRLDSTAVRVTEPNGTRVYRVVAPVVQQWGGHMYSLVSTFSYERVDRQFRSSLWLSALVIVVGLGLTHWVSVTLAGGIMQGVERLREGAQRLREGKLDERVFVSSRDEIEELVQLSHLERFTSLDAAREEIALRSLLEGIVDTFRPRVEARGIDLTLRLNQNLPLLESNGEQIERVFLNILDKAVKLTPSGGTILFIAEPYVHEGRDGVLVRVRDSGVGIPRAALVRIFDRFHQVDPSSRRRYGGMGLGLSLVRNIVEAHRGAVWAESEEGFGSTFIVWLPIAGKTRRAPIAGQPSVRLDNDGADRHEVEEA